MCDARVPGWSEGVHVMVHRKGKAKSIDQQDMVFDEENMPYLKEEYVQTSASSENTTQVFMQQDDEPVSDGSMAQDTDQESHTDEGGGTAVDENVGVRGRPRRQARQPVKFSDYDMSLFALCVAKSLECTEPASYKEAMKSREWRKWLAAMEEEIHSLLKNGTWILVKDPKNQKIISCKWIYKKKVEVAGDSETIRFEARLVAHGFTQEEGVDFNEIFSSVVKHTSIRILLALVAYHDWELEQLDVKTTFLHGDLEETIGAARGFCSRRK